MKFSLIVCTYLRPKPLLELLESVKKQTLYPDEILIIDSSENKETENLLEKNVFPNLKYFNVPPEYKGLTKQRNYGIKKVDDDITIVCFLDDDIILDLDYFKKLIGTYSEYPGALGIGGYITNEILWNKVESENYSPSIKEYYYDGYVRKDGVRFVIRKIFDLDSDVPPGYFPAFGHGRSIGFIPPSSKTYSVENFMGGVASYNKEIFDKIKFSDYFSGYGLYEDADFCFRLNKLGSLYVNTAAKCEHHHAPSGRPNYFNYGKMVLRNGWYVWRVKNPNPNINARFKWHATIILLTLIRFGNIITTNKKREAFTEATGRTIGWWSLWFNRPKNN